MRGVSRGLAVCAAMLTMLIVAGPAHALPTLPVLNFAPYVAPTKLIPNETGVCSDAVIPPYTTTRTCGVNIGPVAVGCTDTVHSEQYDSRTTTRCGITGALGAFCDDEWVQAHQFHGVATSCTIEVAGNQAACGSREASHLYSTTTERSCSFNDAVVGCGTTTQPTKRTTCRVTSAGTTIIEFDVPEAIASLLPLRP